MIWDALASFSAAITVPSRSFSASITVPRQEITEIETGFFSGRPSSYLLSRQAGGWVSSYFRRGTGVRSNRDKEVVITSLY